MRIRHVEIDTPVAVLRVVSDVDIVRVLIGRERWQHVLDVAGYRRIHDLRIGPGLSAVCGADVQNIRSCAGAKYQAG